MRLLQLLICAPMLAMALGLAVSSVGALGLSKPPNLENIHMTLGEKYQFSIRIYGENQLIEVEMVAAGAIENFIEFDPQRFTLATGESKEVLCTLSPENLGTYEGSLEARPVSMAQGNPLVGSVSANLRVTVEEPLIEQPSGEYEQPSSGDSTGGGISAVQPGVVIALLGAAFVSGLYLVRWR